MSIEEVIKLLKELQRYGEEGLSIDECIGRRINKAIQSDNQELKTLEYFFTNALLKSEPPAGEFTRNWRTKRKAFAEMKPNKEDELDYMQIICGKIHELLRLGDDACKLIDRLEAENKAKNELLKKSIDCIRKQSNVGKEQMQFIKEVDNALKGEWK